MRRGGERRGESGIHRTEGEEREGKERGEREERIKWITKGRKGLVQYKHTTCTCKKFKFPKYQLLNVVFLQDPDLSARWWTQTVLTCRAPV